MPECWFRSLPGAGECDGGLVRCHLIPKNKLALEFPRGAVWPVGEGYPAKRAPKDLRDAGPAGRFMPLGGLQADPRCWVWGCGGPMGNAGHQGQFKPDGPLPIPRHRLPAELIEFAREIGLEWWIDRTYPEVAL